MSCAAAALDEPCCVLLPARCLCISGGWILPFSSFKASLAQDKHTPCHAHRGLHECSVWRRGRRRGGKSSAKADLTMSSPGLQSSEAQATSEQSSASCTGPAFTLAPTCRPPSHLSTSALSLLGPPTPDLLLQCCPRRPSSATPAAPPGQCPAHFREAFPRPQDTISCPFPSPHHCFHPRCPTSGPSLR